MYRNYNTTLPVLALLDLPANHHKLPRPFWALLGIDVALALRAFLYTQQLLFTKLLMTVVVIDRMKVHQMANVGVSQRRGLKLFGREIIFEEFQPM